ncbi:hypothetical protein CKO23_18545 [Thiocystis violacea]|nr:hypothetical protein [Thiocystis violacea]
MLLLTGCASQGKRLVDGDAIPPEIARVPDAVPKVEPLSRSGNPDSYVVFGKRYYPKKDSHGHVERGFASWYGEPFHGRKTSSGEIYDMHAMTAAHKTLPLPTYARVTNVENGRSVVVRINDRGPFHGPRVIDLSYTAAVKLGVVKKGTAKVEIKAIDPRRDNADTGPFLASQEASRPARAKTASAASAADERRRSPRTQAKTTLEQPPTVAHTPSRPRTARALASSERPWTPSQGGRTGYLQVGAFGDQRNAERLRERLASQLSTSGVEILEPGQSGQALYKVRVGPLASEQDAQRISKQLTGLGVGNPRLIWN